MERFQDMMKWLACVYVNTLNIIHYMHDKYSYERLQMALHDKKVTRWFATGIAGLSVVADSLSAIKYAKVKPIRDENGIAIDYEIEGDFPKYGNDDDRVDSNNFYPDHYLQCGIWKGNRFYSGWKKSGTGLCSGCKPYAPQRPSRRCGLFKFCFQASF